MPAAECFGFDISVLLASQTTRTMARSGMKALRKRRLTGTPFKGTGTFFRVVRPILSKPYKPGSEVEPAGVCAGRSGASSAHKTTADCRPRTSTSPTGRRSGGGRRSATRVDSERRIGPPSVFVRLSMRDAVLTVSPWTVYSSRRNEPTFPDMKGPLFDADTHVYVLPESVRAQPVVEARETHFDHVACGRESAIGVVLDLDRRAERREEAVASVRDERPTVLEDRVARLVEVAVERIDHELGRAVLRERREPSQVGEHHGARRC